MARKREKPIRVAHNEVTNVAPGGGANGAVLTLLLHCGACGYKFERNYTMAQLTLGAFPHETCEECDTVNYVPFSASGRNDAR